MSSTKEYHSSNDILEAISRDCTGRKIEKHIASCGDYKQVAKIFKSIVEKYSLPIRIIIVENFVPDVEEDLVKW